MSDSDPTAALAGELPGRAGGGGGRGGGGRGGGGAVGGAAVGVSLADAVSSNVHRGDTVQVLLGHSRWTALARELARQQWGSDPGLTLVMTSLGALGALFFEGGLVSRVVTTYSGNSFPTYTPNPIFRRAYESGSVAVEHWSILTLSQRLEAAARGLPAVTTGSLAGSSMADNEGYELVDTPFGPVGLLAPLAPDVVLLHAAAADRAGNLAMSPPFLEGLWGAWAARRGVVASVERIVDSLDELGAAGPGQYVQVPAHRVLAVAEAPFGAHPGGCFAPGLLVTSYGEDIANWISATEAAARGEFGAWAKEWALDPADHADYLARVGGGRLEWLAGRSDPESWRADAAAVPVPPVDTVAVSDWEVAAALAAREVQSVLTAVGADAVLAGAGVANLAAWVAVGRARAAGSSVRLTAELGLLGYSPTPADPYIFNHRSFPGTEQLSDASTVLGMVIGGPGTVSVGCLGAAEVDQEGNLNSTQLGSGRFLVGSGGANDVASRASACVVVTLARPERLPSAVGYVTSPGSSVVSLVTDRGVLRRHDGVLRLEAVPGVTGGGTGAPSVTERVERFRSGCGWDVEVASSVEELAPVSSSEVLALREFDRERLFLA